MSVLPLNRRPLGFRTHEEAALDAQVPDNPHVRRIAQLADGSWAQEWLSGIVTGPKGAIPPSVVQWAPEPVIGVVFRVSDELRRRVALATPCVLELADDDELRRWLVGAVSRELAELETSGRPS
jgi:hypothetical protein